MIRDAITALPCWVDTTTRAQIEVDLVRVAVGVGPKELRETAALRLFLLDQDGPEPDDAERARKRGVSVGRQGRDAMTSLSAELTPEAWAVWEVIFAKYAAPGMCNPADPEPCTSGTPTQAQIDNDHRSLAQRQHDALLAVGRIALMSGELGHLNGLPVIGHHPHHPARPGKPRRHRRHRRGHHNCRSPTSSAWAPTPTTTWRCSTGPPARRWSCSAPDASPPRPSGSC